MLTLEGISKEINHNSILNNISLDVQPGEHVLLLGANGAGKSTLLRICCGLMRSSKGTVRCGDSLREIGYMGHHSMLYSQLTVRENLNFFADLCGAEAAHVEEGIVRWCLQAHVGKKPADLSKGLLARVSLCRALIHRPKLVFLDEPSSALDHSACDTLLEELEALRTHHQQRMILMLATHDLSRLKKIVNRVVILSAGELLHDSKGSSNLDESIELYLKHNR